MFQWAEQVYQANQEAFHSADSFLSDLIACLRAAGPSTWTEYRILPIEQSALEGLPADDLISRAYARLDDLKEYDEKKSPEEKAYFEERDHRLRQSIDGIRNGNANSDREDATRALKADLRMLLETLADYDKNWAVGSEILRALLIIVSFAIPVFLLMGVAPALMPPIDSLGFINWAFLGVAGALTAVLRKLYLNTKVEVGDTEGKNELYQSIKGATLGLVSGFLAFMMLWGELLAPGTVVPDVTKADLTNIYLSVFWAFMTGFAFENFFDRVQKEKVAVSN